MITSELLDVWFTYHTPTPEQVQVYKELRRAAATFADTVVRHTIACADQTAAIRKIREAVMTANAAIACGGK